MTTVAVIGLGKIGLPLAVQLAQHDFEVIGVDVQQSVVDAVNDGREPFPGETELAPRLAKVLGANRLRATTDGAAAVAASGVVVVVVPLVVDTRGVPDFTLLDAATDAIGRALQPATLVSYETTLPVHTTRRRFVPALEERSGLRCGEDLYVCHSPERVYSGRIFADLRRYPKLVGGVDIESGRRAVSFYEAGLDFDDRPDLNRPNGVWDLGSAEAAELAKLAETTYRDLNIAFANELAVAADGLGIDIDAVIDASNSQPYSHIHRPGIAVGGHCIPVYPHFLLTSVEGFRLPAVAREINQSMPGRAVDVLERALGDLRGRRVVVLGLAYRGGVKEHAFSGAFPLVHEIESRGGAALVHDPLYDDVELRRLGFEPFHPGEPADAVILQADHVHYRSFSAADVPGVKVVYDGRGTLDTARWEGVRIELLGRPPI